jgi:hypothetical protein
MEMDIHVTIFNTKVMASMINMEQSQINPVHTTSAYFFKIHFKTLYAFHFPPIHATYYSHLNLLN